MKRGIICKRLLRIVAKVAPIVITAASLTAAVTPRIDSEGNQTAWHKYLDVFALNVLNSAHEAGYMPEFRCDLKD